MAGSINKVILVGNLGNDPQIKDLKDGSKCAVLSLATSDRFKDKNTGEIRENTEWHRVVVYNDSMVGVCKSMVQKGTRLYIEGSIHTRKWHNNADEDVYTTEILVRNYSDKLIVLSNAKAREEIPVDNPSLDGIKVVELNDIDAEIPF